MTSLKITAKSEKKRLSFSGDKISFGEKVNITVEGIEISSTTRLRVLVGGETVAMFPLEEGDAWNENTCVLKLNTIQAERAHCGMGVFILEDAEIPRLYGAGDMDFLPWPKKRGDDVPYDLSNFPGQIEAWETELEEIRLTAEDAKSSAQSALESANVAAASSAASAASASAAHDAAVESQGSAANSAELAAESAAQAAQSEAGAAGSMNAAQAAKTDAEAARDKAKGYAESAESVLANAATKAELQEEVDRAKGEELRLNTLISNLDVEIGAVANNASSALDTAGAAKSKAEDAQTLASGSLEAVNRLETEYKAADEMLRNQINDLPRVVEDEASEGYAANARYAIYAEHAATAESATRAGTVAFADLASSAQTAETAKTAETAETAKTAETAEVAETAKTAERANFAGNAEFAASAAVADLCAEAKGVQRSDGTVLSIDDLIMEGRYGLHVGEPIHTSCVLEDHKMNRIVTLGDNVDPVNLSFPAAIEGKARDFLVLITNNEDYTGAITFTLPSGAVVYGDGFTTTIGGGEIYLYAITEVANNEWYVRAIRLDEPQTAIPRYGSVDAAVVDGTVTLTPYSRNALTSDGTAFAVAMGGSNTHLRDCVFVVTAGATAPTISWGTEFHPRTDAATDFACVAGATNVYWITEYAEGEYAVAGWQVTEGGNV